MKTYNNPIRSKIFVGAPAYKQGVVLGISCWAQARVGDRSKVVRLESVIHSIDSNGNRPD